MSITINLTDIKRKAMIPTADSSHDSSITALIAEMQGPVEYSIADMYINDTFDTKLQATLKLGILEIITGEFLEQLTREIGSTEEFSAAGVTLGATSIRGADLIQQGATRLAPYLKAALPQMSETASSSTTINNSTIFSTTGGVW